MKFHATQFKHPLSVLRTHTKQVILFILIGLLLILCVSQVDAAGTVVVSPYNMNGWGFLQETGTAENPGTGQMVVGPDIPPLGTGSAQLITTDPDIGESIATLMPIGTPLSDFTTLTYSAYRISGSSNAVTLQFDIDRDPDPGITVYGRLVFEPANMAGSHPILDDTWQTWDGQDPDARWWITRLSGADPCNQASPCSWSDILINYPGAQLSGAGLLKIGRGWTAFEGNVDNLVIGINNDETTYNFEPCVTPTVENTTTGEMFCAIQSAIDDADTLNGHTITVDAGTYIEDLVIDKSLTLLGPNASVNPNTDIRGTEAIVIPTVSGPDPYGACSIIAYIDADNVTIDGFTFDGDNPALTSGIIIGAADVDACEILAGYEGMGNITVENNILQHSTYSAIDFYNYTDPTATSGNYIRNNLIQNIGETTYNWGLGILIYNNFYADISNNVLENVRVGIQTGNYYQANPGITGQISQNEINAWRLGIFHNLWYSNAALISVDNNTINAIDSTDSTTWNGMLLTSWMGNTNTLIVDNTINIGTITQLASGYNVWNTPTTAPLTISGGTVDGGDYGVFVNNYDGYPPDPDIDQNTAIIMDDVTISNAALVGVYVKDNPSNTNNATVSATVQNSTINNSTVIAVQVEGADAAAAVKGSEIDVTSTVFNLSDGSLLAYANNITNFTTGVTSASGALNARHNWWGNITPTGVNDTDAFDYRLGAERITWGEGSLGSALLTPAGGSGIGIIVSHSRGLAANVPFGKGVPPYANDTCSDYYDFFVLNPNGDWKVSVPIDAGCTNTLANKALYQFSIAETAPVTAPDTDCIGGACWEPPAGVVINGNSLDVTLDAPTYLLGTPFVAGTPDSNDPTAVSLATFSASTNAMGMVTAVILILLTLMTFVLWKRRDA